MAEQTFLVAIDINEDPSRILSEAVKLAEKLEARLIVLTVVKPLAAVYGNLYAMPFAISGQEFEKQAVFNAQKKLLSHTSNLDIQTQDVQTKLGLPAPEIRRTVDELKCDLLIMGTHTRGRIGRLLGSIASAVLHELPCDIHLVKIAAEQ